MGGGCGGSQMGASMWRKLEATIKASCLGLGSKAFRNSMFKCCVDAMHCIHMMQCTPGPSILLSYLIILLSCVTSLLLLLLPFLILLLLLLLFIHAMLPVWHVACRMSLASRHAKVACKRSKHFESKSPHLYSPDDCSLYSIHVSHLMCTRASQRW